jgi:hypothetical protein
MKRYSIDVGNIYDPFSLTKESFSVMWMGLIGSAKRP